MLFTIFCFLHIKLNFLHLRCPLDPANVKKCYAMTKMNVLAQANERQPGPAGSSGQNAHYTIGVSPHLKQKKKRTELSVLFFWWRCGELNPGPKSLHRDFLHAYLTFKFFAPRHVGEPQIDESLMTANLQDAGLALSVFLMPLAKGTENLGATR